MALKLYNALTKKKEEFISINPGKVGMYVCGPTVYDHCHLGHARGYISMDILRRYLEYSGYEVRHIMNYTDVGHLVAETEAGEDKIEKKAKTEKVDPLTIADTYIESCKKDFSALNIESAHFNPRPTKYIAQIIKFAEELIKKGCAYETNGSVYFSVDKFSEYGKLSGKKKGDLIAGSRVEINPEKKNPLDFALWIKADKKHILKWPSPWSLGYPGWHIECSVMSNDLLGQNTFDIHGGGNENAFPHNENEIAQSECYLGKKMANFWILWNMVTVNGTKASKSLGNALSIKNVFKKYDPAVIRFWIINSHYRSTTNYTDESLQQARTNLERISNFVQNLQQPTMQQTIISEFKIAPEIYLGRFEKAMNDDLNTPLALSILYELMTKTNKLFAENKLGAENARQILKIWEKINKVFGLILPEVLEIPEEIKNLAEERKAARKNLNFKISDELRDKILKLGYIIEDLKDNNYTVKKL
jgi:cysteinyl-tRNA synthetase